MTRHRSERVEIQLLEDIAEILIGIQASLAQLVALFNRPYQAITGELSTMATTATLTFIDASGNPAAPPTGDSSGLVVTFASDNPNVTLGAATPNGDTATADITGTEAFNLSVTVANTSGCRALRRRRHHRLRAAPEHSRRRLDASGAPGGDRGALRLVSDPVTIPDPDDPSTTWDPNDPNLPAKLKSDAAQILGTSDSTSDETLVVGKSTFPPKN